MPYYLVFTVLKKEKEKKKRDCLMHLILYCTYRSFSREEGLVKEKDEGLGVYCHVSEFILYSENKTVIGLCV